MSPKAREVLAREHLERAKSGVEENDPTEAVTWLLAALEAAIVAVAEAQGMETPTHHWKKAEVAKELHRDGHLSTDYSNTLDLLNAARKVAVYEGDEPDLDDTSLDELLGHVEGAVKAAEGAAG
jgi:hypothetical protein